MYRKSYVVVGYTYHADLYCVECGSDLPDVDPEGNDKGVVFLDGIHEFAEYACGQCGSHSTEW